MKKKQVDAQNSLVRMHMAKLVDKFKSQRVRFVSLIEGNMSWVVANQIGLVMAEYQPMYHGCKSEKEKLIGLHTSEEASPRFIPKKKFDFSFNYFMLYFRLKLTWSTRQGICYSKTKSKC